uniref:Uncharacterized protein n=1 Tax=Acrobeloides nanus TaxID=290746 RepID=A0A914D8Y3_9BILA
MLVAFGGIAKIVSDQTPGVDVEETMARFLIIVMPIVIFGHAISIYFIWQYKQLLTWKMERKLNMRT